MTLRALAVLVCCLLAGGWQARSYPVPAVCSVDVTALTTGVGTVAANTLAASCLSNPTDTVNANSNWTSVSTKYLSATSGSGAYIAKSVASAQTRDIEVKTWTNRGYVFLRLDSSGNAIYFLHEGSVGTGLLEVGIATGLDESAFPSGTLYPLYSNTDLVGTIGTSGTVCACGYTQTGTDGQAFTFGVSGFNIYAKYTANGVTTQFMMFQEYRQMNAGAVAFKSLDAAHGFRSITITPLQRAPLYSRYWSNQIDLRDFGLRSIAATGSITSGDNHVTLVGSNPGFQVNDWVIVEIGAEAGAGLRGTMGVGGSWPALNKADKATLDLDTTEPLSTFAWVSDTGLIYEWNGAAWSTTFSCSSCATNGLYLNKAIPRSIVAQISAISGNQLTLINTDGTNANAFATATNANVYLDNTLILNNLGQSPRSTQAPITPASLTLSFPAGTYYFSGTTSYPNHPGTWVITGQGQSSTTLKSAKGTVGAKIATQASTGIVVQDLTLQGNNLQSGSDFYGYGLGWTASITPIPTSTAVSEYNAAGVIRATLVGDNQVTETFIGGNWFDNQGITLNSDNSVGQRLTINDVFNNALQCKNATNCWGYNITVNVNAVRQSYTQWSLEFANTTNSGCQDCTITSANMVQGFESFSATGTQFIRPTGTNAAFSINDVGGNWIIRDGTLSINTGGTLAPAWTPGNGLMDIDTNTGADLVGPGTISNMTLSETGYLNANNDVEIGIVLADSGHGPLGATTVSNVTYTAPDYTASGSPTTFGPQTVNSSSATSQTLTNVTACGAMQAGTVSRIRSNIGVSVGSIANSTYNTCSLAGATTCTGTGNVTPCP